VIVEVLHQWRLLDEGEQLLLAMTCLKPIRHVSPFGQVRKGDTLEGLHHGGEIAVEVRGILSTGIVVVF
jgi:hypothetical protein